MQYLSIFKLAEISMCGWNSVLCPRIGTRLFANHEAGRELFSFKDMCNFTWMCPILCFSAPVFPGGDSRHQRKACKDNVALF